MLKFLIFLTASLKALHNDSIDPWISSNLIRQSQSFFFYGKIFNADVTKCFADYIAP